MRDETHAPEPGDEEPEAHDDGTDRRLDEDAAWKEIVERYGDAPSPLLDQPPVTPAEPAKPPEPDPERLRGLFQPTWNDPLETEASWDDEGHFIPPSPPPVVISDRRRRWAWTGLFGSPLLMLVAVVLGWQLPDLVMFVLATGFVGGFVYLIATMPNRHSGGDDGAVV